MAKRTKMVETEEQRDLRMARELRTVLADRSGDEAWLSVELDRLLQFLDQGETAEERADAVEGFGCSPDYV